MAKDPEETQGNYEELEKCAEELRKLTTKYGDKMTRRAIAEQFDIEALESAVVDWGKEYDPEGDTDSDEDSPVDPSG